MAITNSSKVDFCRYIIDHPAREAVIEEIVMKIMRSFQKGNPAVREEAVRTLDSLEFFMVQLQSIVDANKDLGDR